MQNYKKSPTSAPSPRQISLRQLRSVFIFRTAPAAAKGLVQTYQHEVFIAHGVAYIYLCLEIAALSVKNVYIGQCACIAVILQLGQVYVF